MEYIIIFIIFILLFWRIINLGYCVDDSILEQKAKKQRQEWTKKYWVWNTCHGAGSFNTAREEHLVNAGIHLILSCLIFKYTGSIMSSIMYMVNPVTNQTALWINGRRFIINALLIMLILNFKWLEIPLYAFGVWVHVTIVPLILFSKYWYILIPLFFIFGFKKIRERTLIRKSEFKVNDEMQRIRPKKIILCIKTIGFYFYHIIFPNKPRMFHEYMYYFNRYDNEIKKGYSFNFDFLKGLSAIAVLGYEIFYYHSYWALFFLAFIIQWSGIYTVTMLVADRYCSIPAIGLMVILSDHINSLPTPFKEIVYTFFITFYFLRYLPLFDAYKSIPNFYKYHLAIQPDGVEARVCMCNMYLNSTKPDPWRAFSVIKDGLNYRNKDFKLRVAMAKVQFAMGRVHVGMEILERAKEFLPIGEEPYLQKEIDAIKRDIIEPIEKQAFDKHKKRKFKKR